jgi:hypothetical protein
MFSHSLCRPTVYTCSATEGRERHDVLGALLEDLNLRKELTVEHLRQMPDLDSIAYMFKLQDCYKYVLSSRLR